jgi:hypothetical protein
MGNPLHDLAWITAGIIALFAVPLGGYALWHVVAARPWSDAKRAERAAIDRECCARAMRREAAAQREIDALLAEMEARAAKRGGERG